MPTICRRDRSIGLILPLIVTFTPSLASGQDPAQGVKPVVGSPALLGGAPFAVLQGRVKMKGGDALPGVRVRVAIPAADMRFVYPGAGQSVLETTSGGDGEYRLEFPGIGQKTTVSIDALMPGFERLSGTMMAGGDARRVEIEPGKPAMADLALNPALYFRGIVVDEDDHPISGALVDSTIAAARGKASVERTATAHDGSFEVFGYPARPRMFGDLPKKGLIEYSHPDYADFTSEDVYAVEPDRRGNLRAVLPTGRKVSGTVLDDAGKPVARALVETEPVRKATLTDAAGKFSLKGLAGTATTLKARSMEIKQKASLPLELDADRDDVAVHLRPIVLPADLNEITVLGMELADVTPELKSAYDLSLSKGALILDPGPDSDRFGIGQLAEGYSFFMAGNKRVGSVREFVDQILVETAAGAGDYSVRVVFSLKTAESRGSRTQYMKLTKADRDELQVLAEQLKAKAP